MYIDEFVENLSNCIGFISGDELILKKMRYDFEYEIITRNHDIKLGSIKWDIDDHCIVILLNNKSYSFDRSELTIEKTKEIGKMINKAYYNMNESFLKEFTNTYQFEIEWNTGDEYWDNFPDYDEFEGTIEGLNDYLNSQLDKEDPPANFDEETLKTLMDGKTVYDETGTRYSVKLIVKVNESLESAKKLLKENGYLVETKVATKEDFDNLFKTHGFEKKTTGEFDWVKKVYQRYGKGYLKAIVGPDYCKIVYFRFDPTLHWDDEKCYELNDSYTVSFDEEDAITLLRDYIMDYDQE